MMASSMIFGTESMRDEPAVQVLGSVKTPGGRLIAFPNTPAASGLVVRPGRSYSTSAIDASSCCGSWTPTTASARLATCPRSGMTGGLSVRAQALISSCPRKCPI